MPTPAFVRENGGGLTLVALDIASGVPGARAELLSFCRAHVPASSPPATYPDTYARLLDGPVDALLNPRARRVPSGSKAWR